MLKSLHLLMDTARGYRLSQLLGLPTIRRYRTLIHRHVSNKPGSRVLEIGCGVGSSRHLFAGGYTGIDINPDYIRQARARFGGDFQVMNAADMSFAPGSFDEAVSIATGHHLSDEQLGAMIRKAITVAPRLHIIDAILPISPRKRLQTMLFRMDRGKHIRTVDQLRDVVSRNARIEAHEVIEGPLHDVCYFRVSRPG